MKKTAITVAVATVISGFGMTAGSAQAAPIFENDNTRVDLHGRLRMGLVNDDGDNEIKNLSSRFGSRSNHKVSNELSVFANTEFRFNGDEVNSNAMTVRNTFFGVERSGIGRIYFGNFDSIYYQQVSSLLDIVENTGYRALNSGGQRARGDSIAFDSASFGGLRFGVSLKLQPEDETVNQDEAVNAMGYVGYATGPLNVALAVDQANEDFVDGSDDTLIGLAADYKLTSAFTFGGLLESQGDLTHAGITGAYNYGKGRIYGSLSHLDDDGDASDTQYVLGVNYRFSQPMYVFAEYVDSTEAEVGAVDRSIVTVGARYNF